MQDDVKIRVGILRGGDREYYIPSLVRGGDIISYITENLSDKYKTLDILIDKDYVWHLNGLPLNPAELMNKVDVVWNTSHPSFSNILDSLSIVNINNGSFLGILEKNIDLLRKHIKSIGLTMPRSIVLPLYQKDFDGPRDKYAIKKAREIFEKFGSPWMVKSLTLDKNMGIHLAKTFNELVSAIEDGVKHQKSIIIEEFISGKVATVHSLPHFREQDLYTFPLYNSYGDISLLEKEKLINFTKDLHHHLGVKHYLKSDFVLSKSGKVYLLGIDGMPNLKPDSHFSQVCESVGAKAHHIIEHILQSVL